jgi:hypothetical protein
MAVGSSAVWKTGGQARGEEIEDDEEGPLGDGPWRITSSNVLPAALAARAAQAEDASKGTSRM